MEFNLTESQLEIQKLARDFAQNKVAPKSLHYDETQDFPWEFTNELGEMGFMGIFFPEEYGGSNLTTMEYAIIVEEISKAGPMCKEPCFGLKVKLTDAKLHEDAIHRGPGQMIPCTRQAIMNAMLVAGTILYEPRQIIRIDIPTEYLNETTKLVAGRRGELQEVIQEEAAAIVKAKIPVNEMFGFTAALRSATSGRGAWFLSDQVFEKLPNDLQLPTIRKLRERKGLPPDLPKPQFD